VLVYRFLLSAGVSETLLLRPGQKSSAPRTVRDERYYRKWHSPNEGLLVPVDVWCHNAAPNGKRGDCADRHEHLGRFSCTLVERRNRVRRARFAHHVSSHH